MSGRQVNAPGYQGQYPGSGQYSGSGHYGGGGGSQYQGGQYSQGPPPPGQYQDPEPGYSGGQYHGEELWDAESAPESEDQDYGRGGSKGGGGFSPGNVALILGGVVGLCGACVGGFFLFGGSGGPATTTATPAWGLMAAAPVVNATTTPAATSPVSVFDQNTGSLDAGANLYDGNACYDDEELLLGLCYKKCSLLTNGSFPIRSSALSCCESKPCGFRNQKVTVGMCSGLDVSGDHMAQGGCPHKPGACLANEELSVGICYKKCMILTNGTYPFRVSSVTCCKEQGAHCLLPQNVFGGLTSTSFDYQVGGGKGDGIEATPATQHGPLSALTEAADEDSSTTLIATA